MRYGDMTKEEFHESFQRTCDKYVLCKDCPLYRRVCVDMRDVDWEMEEVE